MTYQDFIVALRARTRHDLAILALAALGIGFMAYLSVLHFRTGSDSLCHFGAGFDCQIVNQSLYSSILGVPVAFLGLAYFVTVFLLTLLAPRWAPVVIQPFTVGSLVFGFYLSAIEWKVLATFCLFCELSKICMLGIFLASYRGARAAGIPVPTKFLGAALLGGAAFTLFAAAYHF